MYARLDQQCSLEVYQPLYYPLPPVPSREAAIVDLERLDDTLEQERREESCYVLRGRS